MKSKLEYLVSKHSLLWLIILVMALSFFGCGKSAQNKSKIVATVNGEPIYAEDLQKELTLRTSQDPLLQITPEAIDEQLQTLIDKRLLIQEAKKNRLDERDRFIHSIKLYWEQTLIRDLIHFKAKELDNSAAVTEAEIKDYYDKSSFEATMDVVKRKDKHLIEKLFELPASEVKWDHEAGPVNLWGITEPVMSQAFMLAEGEKKIFEDGEFYYLIFMKKKSHVPVGAFDAVKDSIQKRLEDSKRQAAFNQWFGDFKKKTNIAVHRDVLKTIENRYV